MAPRPRGKANRDVAGGAVAEGCQCERGQELLQSHEVRKGSTKVGQLGGGWSQGSSRSPDEVGPLSRGTPPRWTGLGRGR